MAKKKGETIKVRVFEVTFTVVVRADKLSEDVGVAADEVTDIIEKVWDGGEKLVKEAGEVSVYDSYTFVAEHVEDNEVDD